MNNRPSERTDGATGRNDVFSCDRLRRVIPMTGQLASRGTPPDGSCRGLGARMRREVDGRAERAGKAMPRNARAIDARRSLCIMRCEIPIVPSVVEEDRELIDGRTCG